MAFCGEIYLARFSFEKKRTKENAKTSQKLINRVTKCMKRCIHNTHASEIITNSRKQQLCLFCEDLLQAGEQSDRQELDPQQAVDTTPLFSALC